MVGVCGLYIAKVRFWDVCICWSLTAFLVSKLDAFAGAQFLDEYRGSPESLGIARGKGRDRIAPRFLGGANQPIGR